MFWGAALSFEVKVPAFEFQFYLQFSLPAYVEPGSLAAEMAQGIGLLSPEQETCLELLGLHFGLVVVPAVGCIWEMNDTTYTLSLYFK